MISLHVVKSGFLLILLIRSIYGFCPESMVDGWKQLSLAERTRRAHVVAIGKAITVDTDPILRDYKTAGFKFSIILKGHKIIEDIYANSTQSIFYIVGFGSPSLCNTDVIKDETYLVFAKFVRAKMVLHVLLNVQSGGTASPSIKNQEEVLASLGE